MGLSVQTVALTCFALLGAGYVIMFLLERNPKLAPTIRDAWPIYYTEMLIVSVAAGAFWMGGWVLWAVLLAHAARVGFEAAKVVNRRFRIADPIHVAVGVPVACLLLSLVRLELLCILAVLGILACILARRFKLVSPYRKPAAILDFLILPGIPVIIFTVAGFQEHYSVWILSAFLLVETFDSYALLGGKLFGRRKAFPLLSPNKTVEGLAIGAGMLILTAALAGALLAGMPLWMTAAIALMSGAFTIAGDLTASRLKRLSRVKDYPRILPQQGGLLDITDAWIATGSGLICLALLYGAF